MNKEEVLKVIDKNYSPLSLECQADLLAVSSIRFIDKGEVIVKEGQYADKVYFILKGCARAYYINDGKDVSDWFAFENEFISSIVSFFGKQPSPHYIEFVEQSIVFEVSRESIESLSKKYHEFERLIRVVVTKVMLSQQERISSILFQTSEQRYKHFISVHPNITNRIPLMHIASHLGMTLETLSRVRNPKKRI